MFETKEQRYKGLQSIHMTIFLKLGLNVWVIGILVIWICFGFRASYFGFMLMQNGYRPLWGLPEVQVDSHFSEGILNSEGSVVVVTLLSVSGSIRCT